MRNSQLGIRFVGFLLVLASGLYVGMLPGASAVASGVIPGIGLIHLGDTLSNASNQSSYSTVVVSQDDAPAAAALPGRSLVYFAGPDVNTQWNAGVTYSQATANGWLLKDASGNLLVNKSFANDYVGDIGSAAYQSQWVTNVSAFLASSGADGVFIDDIIRDPRPLAGTYPAKYSTQAAWEAAMVSFVKTVGPALKAKGYYVLINATGYTPGDAGSDNGSLTAQFWQELGPSVNGLCTEYWQQTAEGSYTLRASGTSTWMQNWDGWQKLVPTAQAMGNDFVGMSYGATGDTRTMMFGAASFLLEWNGTSGSYMFDPFDNSDPWNPAWTTNIGSPAAAKQQVGAGWMRVYTGGVALVNPSPSVSQTFPLGGPYLTPSGQSVTSVSLAPTTAMVLHTAGGVPVTTSVASSTATTTTATMTTAQSPTTTATATTTGTTTTASSGGGGGGGGSSATTTTTTTTPTPTPTTTTTTTPTTTTKKTSSPPGNAYGKAPHNNVYHL
jgi:hypothetical protein